jgi:hypothetical protein
MVTVTAVSFSLFFSVATDRDHANFAIDGNSAGNGNDGNAAGNGSNDGNGTCASRCKNMFKEVILISSSWCSGDGNGNKFGNGESSSPFNRDGF